MAEFPTTGVLSVSTGRLMNTMDEVYDVMSFFIGRPIFTHEIPLFSDRVSKALAALRPELPTPGQMDEVLASSTGFEAVRSSLIDRFGSTMDIPDAAAGSAFVNSSPIDTIAQVMAAGAARQKVRARAGQGRRNG